MEKQNDLQKGNQKAPDTTKIKVDVKTEETTTKETVIKEIDYNNDDNLGMDAIPGWPFLPMDLPQF